MKPALWTGDDRLRTATFDGQRWLSHLQLWRPTDPDLLQTAEVETAVLLLSGTFDLIAGTTTWPARGARQSPFEGRPMAVFLPKQTAFHTQKGRGELLLVAARQPIAPAAAEQGREGLSHKPLLPLAGSGKAFDPKTGEWLPAEMFPSSPESLPPRRMQRLQVGDVVVERVLAEDYKAATLSVEEVVVPAQMTLRVADIPDRPAADEVLVFVRSEAGASLQLGAAPTLVQGDAAFVLTRQDAGQLTIVADRGPAYVVLAYAGKA